MAKIDREKVMKGLACCTNGDVVVPLCEECPYTGLDGTCATLSVMHQDALELLKEQDRIIHCKDCRYYEVKDYWVDFNGVPILGASDQPTCTKWGNTECATKPDGYCFLGEGK